MGDEAQQVQCPEEDSAGTRCSFHGAPGETHDHYVDDLVVEREISR